MSGPDRRPVARRVFDSGVLVAGLLVTAYSVLSLWTGSGGDRVQPALLLAVPVIVLMARFPLVLDRDGGDVEIGFDLAVLVFLACMGDGHSAMLLWAVGIVVAQALSDKPRRIKLFNSGLGMVAGGLALAVMHAVGTMGRTSPRELAAVCLGCAVYFVVDYAVSGVSLALEKVSSLRTQLLRPGAVLALAVVVATDSLGYLAALVARSLPHWTVVLLAVPIATILVAASALARGREHARRLTALLGAAVDLQTLDSTASIPGAVRAHAVEVVAAPEARLQAEPPGPTQVGAPLHAADGTWWLVVPARNRARSTVAADGQALAALAAVADEALGRRALIDEMSRRARQDALTGLANRALFLGRVADAVAAAARPGAATCAVLFLDLDGFKSVNDRYGHGAGDALLRAVAERIAGVVRAEDTVARLGGDEFAVLVATLPDEEHAERLCRRLLCTLEASVEVVDGHEVEAGASIGVAVWAPGDDADALMRNADMAMYRAKAEGKRRFAVYEPALRAATIARIELLDDLRASIPDRLVVHYQPVVQFSTGHVEGLEALVRWRRGGRLVPPGKFVTVAEEAGLIGRIGEAVIDQVAADAPALFAAAGRPLSIGVNVSGYQLRDPRLVERVRAAVAALDGAALVVEITESVLVRDDATTRRTLLALRDAGANMIVDDFGVGFSSIGYLQRMPVMGLKIDRSFVAGLGVDPRARALVEAVVLMAGSLGLVVVAEGIERTEHQDVLVELGCNLGQGYLYSRPQPLEGTLALLRKRADDLVPWAGRRGPGGAGAAGELTTLGGQRCALRAVPAS